MREVNRLPNDIRLINRIITTISDKIPDGSVIIPDGSYTHTATAKIVEGQTIRLYLSRVLRDLPDSDFPDFTNWADLDLNTVTAIIRYKGLSYTFTQEDFTAKPGYTYLDEAQSDPLSVAAAIFFNTSNMQFRIREVGGSTQGAIVRSTFTPEESVSTGTFIGPFANLGAATASANYNVATRQTIFNIAADNFYQHSPASSTWFPVSVTVGFSGTFIFRADADTQTEVLNWIESNSPNTNTNYGYYDTADGMLYDVRYTAPVTTGWMDATIADVTNASNPIFIDATDDINLETYFRANPFTSTNSYFYFNATLGQVRHLTNVLTNVVWIDLPMTGEIHEIEASELIIDSMKLQSQGYIDISLIDDAITMSHLDQFELYFVFN